MKVSKEWLNEYISVDVSTDELAEKITRSGIEVDDVIDYTNEVTKLVVGYVESITQHPNADKLNICQVNTGEETKQIICGAPNVKSDSYVIVCQVGGRLPGGVKIKRAKLRDEVSEGMICSLEEIGIHKDLVPKEYEDGIYIFQQDVTPGTDALEALLLDDQVLEFDLTANRKDALSMLGVAYETASLFGGEVSHPKTQYTEHKDIETDITVKNDNNDVVPYYGLLTVKDIEIKPSPFWMQIRLIKYGVRPINNVVDISNYVMLEYGQPLHIFDKDQIGSNTIVTRLASENETITTLDDKERQLTTNDIVVTNGTEPIALAGVMGGDFSEVTERTKNVVIESAVFEPTHVRKTSGRLKLRSEASSRFEKGVSHQFVIEALKRAAYLLEQYANGTVVGDVVSDGELHTEDSIIQTTVTFINNRLGTNFTSEDISNVLNKLGLKTEANGEDLNIYIPSRRDDLKIQDDISEEVARIYGYDLIPSTLPEHSNITPGGLTTKQMKKRVVKRTLEAFGLTETINYALTSNDKALQFTNITDSLKLMIPLSVERSALRNSLLPHLVENLKYNNNRQVKDIALYEIGKVFRTNGQEELPDEVMNVAGIVSGKMHQTNWKQLHYEADFYLAKGIVEGIVEKLGLIDDISYQRSTSIEELHPGRTAEVLLNNDESIGYIGELHPQYANNNDIDSAAVFELNLDKLLNQNTGIIQYEQLSKYPSINRDIALVVDRDVDVDQLIQIIHRNAKKYLINSEVFDVYEGEHMEKGKKSIAIRLTYSNRNETLTDEALESVHQPVIEALKENGATLRS